MSESEAPVRAVLVVDDDELLLELLHEVLSGEGYTVHAAADGAQASVLLASHEIGVAILDKNLPGKQSGLDLLRVINSTSRLTRSMIFTGYASKESAIEALQQGAFDYLEKPLDIDIVVAKVRRAWEAYELAAEHQAIFRKYETLFEIVPGIVWFLAQDGVFKRINHEGAALLGYAPNELLERPYDLLLAEGDSGDGEMWAFKERRTGERALRHQMVRLRTRSGETRLFEFSSTGAWDRSLNDPQRRFWGTLGVGWDVTEQALLHEKLRQAGKMEAIGRLAGGLAHDFNNLLTVIITNAEAVRRSSAGEDQEAVAQIKRAAVHAAELTAQLLAFSRKKVVYPRIIDPGEVVRRLEPMLRRLIPENIRLVINVPAVELRIKADPSQLEQVVINLAVNARDAMPSGGTLTLGVGTRSLDQAFVECRPPLQAATYCVLSVVDTGCGMDAQVREHLFEPFYTTKAPGRGTGLGLATSYAVVTQAGGHIDVDSGPSRGTTMTVYLPLTDEVAVDPPAAEATKVSAGHEAVLMVEDDPMVRLSARGILERGGYRVADAESGEAALALAAGQQFDLLVTDLVMPGIDGTELARRLRQRQPELPVLFVSGYPGDSPPEPVDFARARYLQKPFHTRTLLEAVRRVLDGDVEP